MKSNLRKLKLRRETLQIVTGGHVPSERQSECNCTMVCTVATGATNCLTKCGPSIGCTVYSGVCL